MAQRQVKIAFGPVGLAGLIAILVAAVRRSPGLAAAGALAVAADATLPELGGFAALRQRLAEPVPEPALSAETLHSGNTPVTPAAV